MYDRPKEGHGRKRDQFQCSEEDIQSFGLGCTEEEPCPIYLELSAFETLGNQLFAVGNIHSAANTLYSIGLASADGGKTWREPFQRVRGPSSRASRKRTQPQRE